MDFSKALIKLVTAYSSINYNTMELKPVLHPAVRASTGKNWPNRKAHARRTCGVFTPQTTRKDSQKSFGMTIIFCVHLAIIDSQSARKGLVQRKSVTLAISLRLSQV
jgi:hypothetical protein